MINYFSLEASRGTLFILNTILIQYQLFPFKITDLTQIKFVLNSEYFGYPLVCKISLIASTNVIDASSGKISFY